MYVVPAMLVSFCGLAAMNLVLLLRELPEDGEPKPSKHTHVTVVEQEAPELKRREQGLPKGNGPWSQVRSSVSAFGALCVGAPGPQNCAQALRCEDELFHLLLCASVRRRDIEICKPRSMVFYCGVCGLHNT